jgi:hypothetical protein
MREHGGGGGGQGTTFWFSLFTPWSWQEFQGTPPTLRFILSKASDSAMYFDCKK